MRTQRQGLKPRWRLATPRSPRPRPSSQEIAGSFEPLLHSAFFNTVCGELLVRRAALEVARGQIAADAEAAGVLRAALGEGDATTAGVLLRGGRAFVVDSDLLVALLVAAIRGLDSAALVTAAIHTRREDGGVGGVRLAVLHADGTMASS